MSVKHSAAPTLTVGELTAAPPTLVRTPSLGSQVALALPGSARDEIAQQWVESTELQDSAIHENEPGSPSSEDLAAYLNANLWDFVETAQDMEDDVVRQDVALGP